MIEGVNEKKPSNIKTIQVNKNATNGQNKCPKCGSTEISVNNKTGKLRCNFCRFEYDIEKSDVITDDIFNLKGTIIGSGAKNISSDANDIVTLKCTSCAAEVVIDTKDALQSRCHWCRNILSLNNTLPNGAIPDVILPFSVMKADASKSIDEFVKKRTFFAHPKFKKEFKPDNVMQVYLPYMVVDLNAHAKLSGQGEVLIRKYTVKSGDSTRTYYDADLYALSREFDIAIHDLTVETNLEKLDYKNQNQTNNIINSIMPFDIENAVKWDANYLSGCSSEKRNISINDIDEMVVTQGKDVARHKAIEFISEYNRGVKWSSEEFKVIGSQWIAAYLPVWLYSYYEKKGDNGILHYVSVNGRTTETMGSVPLNFVKLIIISLLVEFLGFLGFISWDSDISAICLSSGIIYYIVIYSRYRNKSARHTYEKETKTETCNIIKEDKYIKRRNRLSSSTMSGANHNSVHGNDINSDNLEENINIEGVE